MQLEEDATTVEIVDFGDRVEVAPQHLPLGGFWIDYRNEGRNPGVCEIFEAPDGMDATDALVLLSRPEERVVRIAAGLSPLEQANSTVAHFVDGLPRGTYVVLCGADNSTHEGARGQLLEVGVDS